MSIFIHIPHSSTAIPKQYRADILLTDEELQKELLAMTDLYTDEIFPADKPRLVFPVSRLICDVERFRNNSDEVMAERGMGAVYINNHQLKPLRLFDEVKRDRILNQYYDSHHQEFTNQVRDILERDGNCLIIDAHSFSGIPLPYEMDQNDVRPDICIGTDTFHTPRELAEKCKRLFESHGLTVAYDSPFAGTIVPLEFYGINKSVTSIMIEINRKLYMDSRGSKKEYFLELQRIIHDVIEQL